MLQAFCLRHDNLVEQRLQVLHIFTEIRDIDPVQFRNRAPGTAVAPLFNKIDTVSLIIKIICGLVKLCEELAEAMYHHNDGFCIRPDRGIVMNAFSLVSGEMAADNMLLQPGADNRVHIFTVIHLVKGNHNAPPVKSFLLPRRRSISQRFRIVFLIP